MPKKIISGKVKTPNPNEFQHDSVEFNTVSPVLPAIN